MKKKVLVLTHVEFDNSYGAATSLRKHLAIVSKLDIENTVVANRYLRTFLLEKFGIKKLINTCLHLPMPLMKVHDYYEGENSSVSISAIVRMIFKIPFYAYSFFYLLFLIHIKGIRVLHLNSPVLIGLGALLKTFSFLRNIKLMVHMRDFLREDLNAFDRWSLGKVDFFVCIDIALQENFESIFPVNQNQNYVVILNPFESVSEDAVTFQVGYDFKDDHIYFAIVGNIIPDKGVSFVLDNFSDDLPVNLCLLIVGSGEGRYYDQCLEKVSLNTRVSYLGEIEDLARSNFYQKIDCVIRGDESFRTGRTVFEALYNDCSVLIPKAEGAGLCDSALEPFSDLVTYYAPREELSLLNAIKSVKKKSNKGKALSHSNHNEYAEKFRSVYQQL